MEMKKYMLISLIAFFLFLLALEEIRKPNAEQREQVQQVLDSGRQLQRQTRAFLQKANRFPRGSFFDSVCFYHWLTGSDTLYVENAGFWHVYTSDRPGWAIVSTDPGKATYRNDSLFCNGGMAFIDTVY
jgi:hypothetical protein